MIVSHVLFSTVIKMGLQTNIAKYSSSLKIEDGMGIFLSGRPLLYLAITRWS